MGILSAQLSQILFGLTFFPTGRVFPDHEKVGGVQYTHPLTTGALVIQLECGRLIEILRDIGIVFEFIDRRQFDPMAFELNGDSHPFTRVTAAYIAASPTYAARGIGRPNTLNRSSAAFRQPGFFVPRQNIDIGKHDASFDRGYDCFLRCAFRACAYRTPASLIKSRRCRPLSTAF
jgi:hypothetical protein